jgi:uncharacterized membrane protein
MKPEYFTLLAIAGMAAGTYATRILGLILHRRIRLEGRVKAAFDALPPAILVAVIAPTVFATGVPETLSAAVTAGAAVLRLPLIVVVVVGVISVVALRTLLR